MPDTTFIRLPARRYGILRRASLWDAGDYLLSISGNVFSERYHRFYYGDIKSIVVQNGPRLGSIGAMLFTAWLCLPFLIAAFRTDASTALRALPLLPIAWLAWLVYVNLARSCRVVLYTAVSSQELPAIFRRRSARRTLPKVLNKIAEAQGTIISASSAAEFPAIVAPLADKTQAQPLPASRQILYSAGLFFAAFLVSAFFAYWYRNTAMTAASLLAAKIVLPLLNAVEVAAGVWALFKLFRVRFMNIVRLCIFGGLAILAVRTYALVMVTSLVAQQNATLTVAVTQSQVRFWIGTVDSVLSLLVALGGLISLMLVWQDSESGSFVSSQ